MRLGSLGSDQGILDDVVGLVEGAQHAVGDADEIVAVSGELLDAVHPCLLSQRAVSSMWVVTRRFRR